MKTCHSCTGEMVPTKANYSYTGCGFEVSLEGITVYRCPLCDACAPEIPNIAGLHRTIAKRLSEDQEPLSPQQRRFLIDFIDDSDDAHAIVAGEDLETATDLRVRLLASSAIALDHAKGNRIRTEMATEEKLQPPGRRDSGQVRLSLSINAAGTSWTPTALTA